MSDLMPIVESLEHRWMRAWINGDTRTLKALTSRQFRMVTGSKPCVLLDATSWLQAAGSRYLCNSYRFTDIYVHDLGSMAVFGTQLHLESTVDGREWSGQFWVTDVWRKSGVRRKWRMVERVLSKLEEDPQVLAAIRSLQLWR